MCFLFLHKHDKLWVAIRIASETNFIMFGKKNSVSEAIAKN